MIKNLLAAIGLFVVGQKSYGLYREYCLFKREKGQLAMLSSAASCPEQE